MGSTIIRVLAVDQNPLMREGLALLVRLQIDMQLVGTAATAKEALQMYIGQRPDVTLMDLDMPSTAAIEVVLNIRAAEPCARIIGLSTYEENPVCAQAMAAGVSHCIEKDKLSEILPSLIRTGPWRGTH